MNKQKIKNKEVLWFNFEDYKSLKKRYKDSFCKMNTLFMKESISYTLEVDLSIEDDQIMKNMNEGTRYEVKRCLKEKLKIENINEKRTFLDFYNDFAKAKNLNKISLENMTFSPDLVIRGIKNNDDQFLAIHVYVVDKFSNISRLLYSATSTELFEDNKALIARANRLLHFKDMLYFKANGFKRYDLGGFAYNTENKSLRGINKFKSGFGGKMRKVYNYEPLLIYFIKNCYGKISSSS